MELHARGVLGTLPVMGKKSSEPPLTTREKMRAAAGSSGLTMEEIGVRMGYAKAGARQAVSRLLNGGQNHDPRLSTLQSFAAAIGRPLSELV